jgi:hypothetical protein
MAKQNSGGYSDGNGGLLDSLKGVLVIGLLAWIGISGSYSAGRTVSDKVLKEVKKNDKKHEKIKRREEKERRKEKKQRYKLNRMRASYRK